MATDITKAQWIEAIADPDLAATLQNGTLPAQTLPPTEALWKLMQSYKKAQDALNMESGGGTVPQLATVDLFQMGPNVETSIDGKPYIRGRAQMQCLIFLDSNDVQGVTII